jgi:hypothetical protein
MPLGTHLFQHGCKEVVGDLLCASAQTEFFGILNCEVGKHVVNPTEVDVVKTRIVSNCIDHCSDPTHDAGSFAAVFGRQPQCKPSDQLRSEQINE